jgi:ATP-dependent exoDNAse (exonuclease V) beta subunit
MPSQHGDERKVISPVGPRTDIDNDPLHRYIELKDTEKNRHEQARLLYVACTRARKSLHLLGNTALSSDGESFRPARSDSLLHLLWPAVESEFGRAFCGRKKSSGGNFDAVWALPKLRRFSSHWSLPEVELLADTARTVDTTVTENEVEFYWVGSDARIAGTLVHRWMQLMADGHASKVPAELTLTRKTTTRWLQEMGIGEEAAQPISNRVEQALRATLSDAQGQWILAGDGHAELALTGVIDGALASVVLDRVRVDEDGTHWIVDYKTSTHEGGDLQGFLQVEADRYRPQLARYAEIYRNWSGTDAKCALYFPLLQSFVEVSVQ